MNNNPTSVLFITNLCAPYRVGLFELLARKYPAKFLFFSAGEEPWYDGPSVLGNFDGKYLPGFYVMPKVKINPALITTLLFGRYTHIIQSLNGPVPVLLGFILGRLRGKKYILWSSFWRHPSTTFHRFSFPVVKFLYRHSDAIVVYGTHVRDYLQSLGISASKIFIGWQVQDNKKFLREVTSPERLALRKALGIGPHQKLILFVGRLVEVKGLAYLLKAFQMLNHPLYTLVIIGSGPDEQLLKHEGGHIIHLQKVDGDELYRYYDLADVFVLPSVTTGTSKENWGFVVNEAMCQRCAIITSDAVGAGVGGLVEEGKNGFVVPERNSKQLALAVLKVLSDDTLLHRMQQCSLEIISGWTYEKQAAGFVQAIDFANRKRERKKNYLALPQA